MFTVTIKSTTAEPHKGYYSFVGEGRHRSPKVATRLAREAIARDFNTRPCEAACSPIFDSMTIKKGEKVIMHKEVW